MPFDSMRCLSACERPCAAIEAKVRMRPETVPMQSDQRGDVRQRPEHADPLLDLGLELRQLLAQGGVDLVGALVGVRQAGLDELQDRVVARVAQLDGAVDVAGGHELLDLGKELLRVHAVTAQLEGGPLHDDRDHDSRDDHVDHQEGGVLFDGGPHPALTTTLGRQHQQMTHPRCPFLARRRSGRLPARRQNAPIPRIRRDYSCRLIPDASSARARSSGGRAAEERAASRSPDHRRRSPEHALPHENCKVLLGCDHSRRPNPA
ncbi:MAG: hypothetical protein V9G14_17730 [Cypionkella sp.]